MRKLSDRYTVSVIFDKILILTLSEESLGIAIFYIKLNEYLSLEALFFGSVFWDLVLCE